MNSGELLKTARQLAKMYRVTNGRGFRLKDFNPADTGDFRSEDKPRVKEMLKSGIERLAEYQERLYADNRRALLLIFQAMDAAGKDSAIKHVMSGLNPQGCEVTSFKAPSEEELDHDFLWRCHKRCPERGRIGIFNRSYYEEVLVVRVHPEWLERQRLPRISNAIWKERYADICAFERYLTRNGTVVRKFFLHVSKEEQKRRFLDRIENPDKHWKFSAADVRERRHWADYMRAYEEMIRNTATRDAPWFVVPADNKWFTRMVVASVVIETLAALDLNYPVVDASRRNELEAAKDELLRE